MKLSTRIGIGYGIVMVVMAAVTLVVLLAFGQARAQNRQVHDNHIPSLEIANQLIIQLEHMENAEYLYFSPGQEPDRWEAAFDRGAAAFEDWYIQARPTARLPEERLLYSAIGQHYGAYRHIDARLRQLRRSGAIEAGRRLNGSESLAAAEAVRQAAQRLHDINLAESRTARDAEERALLLSGAIASGLAIAGGLLAGLFWWRTSRDVVKPLTALQRATTTIGEGDYEPVTHPVAARTEELARLQESFNRMAARLAYVTGALQSTNQNLESEVLDRTRALQEAKSRLEGMVEELQGLDRLKSDFLAIVSHELLTPINFISGYGSALEDGVMGELSPEQTKAVCRIMEGTERLTRMVRNVLDFTQLEGDRLHLEPQPTDLAAAIDSAIARIGSQAGAKQLRLEEDVPHPLARVLGDPDRLEQVIVELLDNAVKFTGEGHRIRVRAWEEPEAVVFSVEDPGSGIPAEALTEIFKPFYQVDFTRTRSHGGLGLGLAIARHLIEAMGGTITASSRLGEGASFQVRLPRA